MKVLLSFVGKQDPVSDKTCEEGSIVTLVRYLRPDAVYLFPTARGLDVGSETETEAINTEAWIKDEIGGEIKVFIRPVRLTDPTDYGAIMPAVRREAGAVQDELAGTEAEIHLNCSSGTPQLKSAWLILANAGVFSNSRLWDVGNPLYKKENRIKEIEITFLEEENILHRIGRFAGEFMFLRVAEECRKLKEISIYSYRKEKAGLVQKIFEAYHYWDLIRYGEAYMRLNSVYHELHRARDLADLAAVLGPQVQVLSKLQENSARENDYNLVDLYYNAFRRYIRHDYTDTLARFWRVYEGTLYKCIREKYGIDPVCLPETRKPANLSWLDNALREVYKDRKYISLGKINVEAVRGRSLQKISIPSLLEELRKKRNYSIVAHGMEPVDRDDAGNCMAAMRVLLTHLLPATGNIMEDYPLQEGKIFVVLDSLRQSFCH